MTCSTDDDLEVQAAEVIIGAEQPFDISLYDFCARKWQANEPVTSGETIRPTRPNGFAMQCTATALTGSREPLWPTALAGTADDGSTAWVAVAAGTNGLNAASAPSYEVSPAAGLAIADLAVTESFKLTGAYEGAVAGEYEVTYTFTVDGRARKARQAVVVE